MDESAHPTKPASAPPTTEVEQLLKMLELQGGARKSRRASSAFQSPAVRYGSLIAIVVLALGSVAFMEMFLSQLPKPSQSLPAPPANAPAANISPSGRPDSGSNQ